MSTESTGNRTAGIGGVWECMASLPGERNIRGIDYGDLRQEKGDFTELSNDYELILP